MAVLKFFMNDENEMIAKVFMHEGESKSDSTYKWAQYALHLSIQLNFNHVSYNPFAVDQGCAIQFLNYKIVEENGLNCYGYEAEVYDDEDYDDEDYYYDEDDYLDDDVEFYSNAFTPDTPEEALRAMRQDENYVNIMLDQHDAVKIVGGLLTMTATSGTAIHNALKESAKRLDDKKQ